MSGEVIRRHTYGDARWSGDSVIGIATLSSQPGDSDHIRVVRAGEKRAPENLEGYAALLTDLDLDAHEELGRAASGLPTIDKAHQVEHINEGDILRLDFKKGFVRSLYRVGSPHNSIFATDRCNSNCLMCSQPPKDIDDSEMVEEHLRLVSLIPPTTPTLGISGGEPTLLGADLFRIIAACKGHLPVTRLHMLSNGRRFADREYAAGLAQVGHPDFMVGIPLYSAHIFVLKAGRATS